MISHGLAPTRIQYRNPRLADSFAWAEPWLFHGWEGCFFGDRPFGEGLKFEKWLEHLIYYYDGWFGAAVAPQFPP